MPYKITSWQHRIYLSSWRLCYYFSVCDDEVYNSWKKQYRFQGATEKQSLETIILCVYVLWNGGKPPTNHSVFTQVLIMTKTISYTLEWIREQTEGEMKYRQVPAAISWE